MSGLRDRAKYGIGRGGWADFGRIKGEADGGRRGGTVMDGGRGEVRN